MATTVDLDIVSDAICPWCYIGKRQLEAAAPLLAADGLAVAAAWHPFQLNPEMPAEGVVRAAYRAQKFGDPARVAAIDARVTAAAAAVGLDFHLDRIVRTPNTIAAHRLAWRALKHGTAAQDALVEAMFRAYFVDGRDIGDAGTLADIAAEVGDERASVAAFLAGHAGEAEVRGEDDMVRRAGLSGVPTLIMRRHVLFSGAVPADTMAEAIAGAWKVLSRAAA